MEKKIELKATGETITFIKTSKDSKGEFVEVITTLPANGEGPPSHRHVLQSELFEAIEGRLGLDCGDKKIILELGNLSLCQQTRLTVAILSTATK